MNQQAFSTTCATAPPATTSVALNMFTGCLKIWPCQVPELFYFTVHSKQVDRYESINASNIFDKSLIFKSLFFIKHYEFNYFKHLKNGFSTKIRY